jgi:hypothetical protein
LLTSCPECPEPTGSCLADAALRLLRIHLTFLRWGLVSLAHEIPYSTSNKSSSSFDGL